MHIHQAGEQGLARNIDLQGPFGNRHFARRSNGSDAIFHHHHRTVLNHFIAPHGDDPPPHESHRPLRHVAHHIESDVNSLSRRFRQFLGGTLDEGEGLFDLAAEELGAEGPI